MWSIFHTLFNLANQNLLLRVYKAYNGQGKQHSTHGKFLQLEAHQQVVSRTAPNQSKNSWNFVKSSSHCSLYCELHGVAPGVCITIQLSYWVLFVCLIAMPPSNSGGYRFFWLYIFFFFFDSLLLCISTQPSSCSLRFGLLFALCLLWSLQVHCIHMTSKVIIAFSSQGNARKHKERGIHKCQLHCIWKDLICLVTFIRLSNTTENVWLNLSDANLNYKTAENSSPVMFVLLPTSIDLVKKTKCSCWWPWNAQVFSKHNAVLDCAMPIKQ